MAQAATDNWKLESFIDAMIVELDKAQDTLSLKGVTRKLTYTVQDVNIDLQVFPHFTGGKLRFTVAKPGEDGASRISFQLGSITDRQIVETAKAPVTGDDIPLDDLDDMDDELKQSLRKIGATSVKDVERLRDLDVDVPTVLREKDDKTATGSYDNLASIIGKARRRRSAPMVQSLGIDPAGEGGLMISLRGENLGVDAVGGFPVAAINGTSVNIAEADPRQLILDVPAGLLKSGRNAVEVALDRHAVIKLNLNSSRGKER